MKLDVVPGFVRRVISEKIELDEKIQKLEAAIHSSLPPPSEMPYLGRQLVAMKEYSGILRERLANHGVTL